MKVFNAMQNVREIATVSARLSLTAAWTITIAIVWLIDHCSFVRTDPFAFGYPGLFSPTTRA